jgi:hypothetical protein
MDAAAETETETGTEHAASAGGPEGAALAGGEESQAPDVHAPDDVTTIVADGVRELDDGDAGAEQWEAFGVREGTVEGWQALGFGPFEAALAQGDGYGPGSARHLGRRLQELARGWRHVGMASAEGLRWHRAGFEAKEAARLQDQGVPLERAIASGGGHRLAG